MKCSDDLSLCHSLELYPKYIATGHLGHIPSRELYPKYIAAGHLGHIPSRELYPKYIAARYLGHTPYEELYPKSSDDVSLGIIAVHSIMTQMQA